MNSNKRTINIKITYPKLIFSTSIFNTYIKLRNIYPNITITSIKRRNKTIFKRFSPTRRIKEITYFLFIIDTTFKSILNRKLSMKFSITNSNYIIIIFSLFYTISSIFKSRNKCRRTPK